MLARSWTVAAAYLLLATGVVVQAASVPRLEPRQGPNTVSWDFPNEQTAAFNFTTWLLPVSKEDASKLAGGRPLLTPTDTPSGFTLEKDEHAILIVGGLYSDMRQFDALSIPKLSTIHLYVPWVQAVATSENPFLYHVVTYFNQLVPSLVGSLLQGANSFPAYFDPNYAAYKPIGASDLSLNVDVGLLDNTYDGPGLTSPAFISSFRPSKSAKLPIEYILKLMETPFIRTGTKDTCTKQHFPMKDSFANPFRVAGSVDTGTALTGKPLSFPNAQGASATAQWILGADGHPCGSFV